MPSQKKIVDLLKLTVHFNKFLTYNNSVSLSSQQSSLPLPVINVTEDVGAEKYRPKSAMMASQDNGARPRAGTHKANHYCWLNSVLLLFVSIFFRFPPNRQIECLVCPHVVIDWPQERGVCLTSLLLLYVWPERRARQYPARRLSVYLHGETRPHFACSFWLALGFSRVLVGPLLSHAEPPELFFLY